MAEFDLESFTNRLRELFYDNFPYGSKTNPSGSQKHPKAPEHIRDVAFMRIPIIRSLDTYTFDIGNQVSEEKYPYYHILEDSQVIHIRNKGTKKSKGSQELISDKKARDYGLVKWNGKTYSQEYKKNVRGSRSRLGKARRVFVTNDGQVYKINENANIYENIHYHYIEKMIDKAIPVLCQEFNMKQKRTQSTGLADEYQLQENSNSNLDFAGNIMEILSSFMED
jgi:hypothetical protein